MPTLVLMLMLIPAPTIATSHATSSDDARPRGSVPRTPLAAREWLQYRNPRAGRCGARTAAAAQSITLPHLVPRRIGIGAPRVWVPARPGSRGVLLSMRNFGGCAAALCFAVLLRRWCVRRVSCRRLLLPCCEPPPPPPSRSSVP